MSVKQAKNADILAARAGVHPEATPVELVNVLPVFVPSNEPNATPVQLSDDEFFKIYSETHEKVCQTAAARYEGFKCNPKFHKIKATIKGNPRFHGIRSLDPDGGGAKKDRYTALIYDELAKHYPLKAASEA